MKYRKHVVLYMFLLLPKVQILSNDFFLYKLLLDVTKFLGVSDIMSVWAIYTQSN